MSNAAALLRHRTILLCATVLLAISNALAQGETIRISLYIQGYERSFVDQYKSAFLDLTSKINEAIRRDHPNANLVDIRVEDPITYDTKPDRVYSNHSIMILTPLKWLEFNAARSGEFQAIGVVKDANNKGSTYYSSFIISKKNSDIATFEDIKEKAKMVYLVHEKSTSGYLYLLFALYDNGIIDAPNLPALERKFTAKGIEFEDGKHASVRELVGTHSDSIGSTWEVSPTDNVQVLLRTGVIPQDIVAVSADIKDLSEAIFSALNNPEIVKKLREQPLAIDGVARLTPEFENSLLDLQNKKDRSEQPEFRHYLLIWLRVFAYFAILLVPCLTLRFLAPVISKPMYNVPGKGRAIILALMDSLFTLGLIYLGLFRFKLLPDLQVFDLTNVVTALVLGAIISAFPVMHYVRSLAKGCAVGLDTTFKESGA